ncbi:MAG: response regulator [Lachnospiraceae bacterium]|nr:response regulator [Lachnospiraceae bacterium]
MEMELLMKEQKNSTEQSNRMIKWIHYILGFFLLFTLLFFVIGEFVMPADIPSEQGACNEMEADWERVYPDGSRESVVLPGLWKEERGETVRVETTLPEEQETTWGCIRGSQQDVRVFVDGELREEYSTKDTRIFGKNSASVYVFFKINQEDAGKVLAIETVSHSSYSGRVNQILVGEKQDIVNQFIRESGLILVVAFTTAVISIISVVVSLILRMIHKKEIDIIYLGLGTFLTSLIMITESLIRQFYLPNITVATEIGFFATKLAPYPFLIYVNLIQGKRYQKLHMPVLICIIVNFVVSTGLHVFGIMDFLDTMNVDYVVIVVALIVGGGTLLADLIKHKMREYREVAFGFIAIIIASLWEVYMVYLPGQEGGFVFCIALCFLLLTASVKTGRNMQEIEKERQRAIVTGEAKAQFLAHMSHEIRTPINTIIGMNEMILRENRDEAIKEYACNIESTSKHLLGLINDVLDFSKIDAGKLEITPVQFSLSGMFDLVVQELKFKAENKGLHAEVRIDSSLPKTVFGDELRIRQILSNLISNAIKYTKEGTVTYTVEGKKSENGFTLCFSVADTGIGIRNEDIGSLFESFQRIEEGRNRHIEGTGLGLAITKQLIDLMDGSISVESEYGKGSCFTVRLPLQIVEQSLPDEKTAAVSKESKETEATAKMAEPLFLPGATVLAVDDNEMNLKVVQLLLKRTGIQVDVASGGTECLERCRQKKYDLILMDHMMPEPDGIETLHLLRGETENLNCNTKVIMLTANAIAGSEEQYRKEGFADYLSKPLVAADLEEMLKRHLLPAR